MVAALTGTIIGLRQKIKITFDKEALTKSLVASLVMAMVVAAAEILRYSKYLLPLYVLVGASTYLAALRILRAIKPSDIELLRQYLGTRFDIAVNQLEKHIVAHA